MEKVIEEYPRYSVTDDGQVINNKTRRVMHRHDNGHGYLFVTLRKDGEKHNEYVHCLVMRAFVGECPQGHQVDHIDYNRKNNALSNLRYLPVTENVRRSVSRMYGAERPKVMARPYHNIYPKGNRYYVEIVHHRTLYRIVTRTMADAIRKRDELYERLHSSKEP